MAKFEVLNNIDHKETRVLTTRAADLGDNIMHAMTFPFEFRNVQANYPILFHRNGDGELYPVALFGFQEGENLFLTEEGWQANFIPGMVMRHPFLIGFQKDENGEQVRIMSIDTDHPRVNTEDGEALFQPLGGRTPYLEMMANLLERMYEGNIHGKAFVKAMEQHELIESITFEITLKDQSRNQLLGFYALNEEKVQELDSKVLGEFNKAGFLMPMFMALASTVNIQNLVERKNQQIGTTTDVTAA